MKKIFSLALAALTLFATSCVKDKVYDGASISDISNTIAYTASDEVTVTAKVSALVPLTEVNLVWTTNTRSAGTAVPMVEANGGWMGKIPAQELDTEVSYYIEAFTASSQTKSNIFKYTVGAVPIDYSGLKLNELNGNDKFIEIYNAGADVPSIAGLYIEKDGTNVWTGDNRPLKKGEYLLLYSEDVVIAGEAHEGYDEALVFHSGLSAKKAVRVQLFTPAAASLSDFNLVTFVTKAPASYSRNKDGKWYFADATPGAENIEGTEAVQGLEGGDPVVPTEPGSVILSELNGNDKFIELANPGDEDFDITGYTIEKDGSVNWTAAEGIKIPAKGFLLLYSEDVAADHEGYDENLFFHSGLSAKKAVKIELKSDKAASVECFNLVTCEKTAPASYSKNADGKWYHADATPGAKNVEGTELVTGLE